MTTGEGKDDLAEMGRGNKKEERWRAHSHESIKGIKKLQNETRRDGEGSRAGAPIIVVVAQVGSSV
jgi:hypothetical protein